MTIAAACGRLLACLVISGVAACANWPGVVPRNISETAPAVTRRPPVLAVHLTPNRVELYWQEPNELWELGYPYPPMVLLSYVVHANGQQQVIVKTHYTLRDLRPGTRYLVRISIYDDVSRLPITGYTFAVTTRAAAAHPVAAAAAP